MERNGSKKMGKRTTGKFDRNPRDYYPTPFEAVVPIFPFLKPKTRFIEPMAGDGRLIRHLERDGHKCIYACDIEPLAAGIEKRDSLFFGQTFPRCDAVITNPPWERSVLHKSIESFVDHADTWLLFDADWAYTSQANAYMKLCKMIVVVGRVKWIEGTDNTGMDNCSWYMFSKKKGSTQFIFRG